MSPELREEVELQLAMMRQDLERFAAARHEAASTPPDPVRLSALAAMLHSFYNGVENIFKRIAIHCDGGPPRGESSHAALLELVAKEQPHRPAALSASLAGTLREYMRFRHVFRYAYNFQIRWKDMANLVAGCEIVLDQLEKELRAFLKVTESKQ